MKHRHLVDTLGAPSLAAIDDIVERGGMGDWISLARMAKWDPSIKASILTVVRKTVETSERFDRPSFWISYCDSIDGKDVEARREAIQR